MSAPEAAFANASQSHALDFDDTLPSARAHASAVAAAAGLAVAATTRATLREYLDAFALGVEVVHRLGRALGNGHYDRGWHATSTLGAFGAAATASRLWRLDAEGVRVAWGAAASMASGLTRNFGTDVKPLHAGFAARAGVLAAWLAREGATSNTDPWSGPRGVVDVLGGEQEAVDDGEGWALLRPGVNVKRWPCCFASHRAIAGLEALLAADPVLAHQVDRIDVSFLPGADRALVHDRPTTGLEAKFSVEYPLAALLLDGAIDVASFRDARVQRPEAQALLARVVRVALPGDRLYSGSGEVGHTDVTLHAHGTARHVRIDRVPGSSAWPLSDEAFAGKVVGCVAPALGSDDRALAWLAAARNLDLDAPALDLVAAFGR